MSFEPEQVEAFLSVFENSKQLIAASPGCHYLELLQTPDTPSVLFTYSFWENEEALNNYRHSDLFKTTWAKTKVLFNDKPQAWTVRSLDTVKHFDK